MFSRRVFLKSSALAMVGVGSTPAWLSRALYAADAPTPRKKVLVAIFQRGAVDGLNVVVPFGDKHYYDLRPTIAIPAPTKGKGPPVPKSVAVSTCWACLAEARWASSTRRDSAG